MSEGNSIGLTSYLGLHFSPEAYDMMREELMRVIAEHYPEEMPDRLPLVFPEWDQVLRGA